MTKYNTLTHSVVIIIEYLSIIIYKHILQVK